MFSQKEKLRPYPSLALQPQNQPRGRSRTPFGKVYNMYETELKLLRDYIDNMLGKGFIQPPSSAAGTPVLFPKNPNGSLQLCVDYWRLNQITKKNYYPIPLPTTTWIWELWQAQALFLFETEPTLFKTIPILELLASHWVMMVALDNLRRVSKNCVNGTNLLIIVIHTLFVSVLLFVL